MSQYTIDDLIDFISHLPGVGPRSGKKITVEMIKNKQRLMHGFSKMLDSVCNSIQTCSICRNIDTLNPCSICSNRSGASQVCIVADIDDLWNVEKSNAFLGRYYVLGGYLSISSATLPEDLEIEKLFKVILENGISEVIFALGSTVSAQTTYYFILDKLETFIANNNLPTKISSLAFGIPMGSEIDYLDEGTLSEAIRSRR